VPGHFRTREQMPFYLMGEGHVPCVIFQPGTGLQVVGELYRASEEAVAGMDALERTGEPGGYTRMPVTLERMDSELGEIVTAEIYVRLPTDVQPGEQQSEFLSEYTHEHAVRFVW
jgi:gamma-glutamylcyclotransferase (GGCT)/AIG2-like uncharacterized protein YtfP